MDLLRAADIVTFLVLTTDHRTRGHGLATSGLVNSQDAKSDAMTKVPSMPFGQMHWPCWIGTEFDLKGATSFNYFVFHYVSFVKFAKLYNSTTSNMTIVTQ